MGGWLGVDCDGWMEKWRNGNRELGKLGFKLNRGKIAKAVWSRGMILA